MGDVRTDQPDRRSILKKAGVVGVGVWAAPVVSSITSPAFAQGSPAGLGCTPFAQRSTVSARIVAKSATNQLEFGLQGGGAVCTSCTGGETHDFGEFAGGTELVWYLTDHGNGCGGQPCNVTYVCTDASQATVYSDGSGGYDIYFADAFCDCQGTRGTPPFGPGNYNLHAHVTITPVV
jgi:hypothetical protein